MEQKTIGLRTVTGKVLGDITAISEDGKITMTIYKDTFVYNAFGEPLSVINITTIDPTLKAPPLSLPDEHYFVYVYEFSPHGTGFSAPVEIGFTYYDSELPKSPEELTLQIYRMNGAPDEWEAIPSLWDTETSSVICSTNHLSTYALIAVPLQATEPTPQPAPAPSATHGDWIFLVLILPAASFIFFIYVLLRWRLRNSPAAEEEPKL